MYAYIDRKKKFPVTPLLRAIGFESDKDILNIFGLAEEVKVSKSGLKKYVGRKLSARVLRTWIEDFVDEDTVKWYQLSVNEVIIERIPCLETATSTKSLKPVLKPSSLIRKRKVRMNFTIIYNTLQKDTSNNGKEAWSISIPVEEY